MIILSGVLVVVAIALLVAGIVAGNGDSAQVFGLDALVVIYISIAVSIVSALCLAIGVFLRRKELWGPGAAAAPARPAARKAKKDKRGKAAPPVPAKDATGLPETRLPAADPADDALEIPAPPVDVPEDAIVHVVRGRKRYHLDTCRQLAGRDAEELTYAEAMEEGFSPCTACMPDTALAARAAASAPTSPDAGKAAAAGSPGHEPGAERSRGGLAGHARPASSPHAVPASFDRPGSFEDSASSGRPGAFDKTAEIRRAGEPAAPERPAASPAGPTLTDMPVAGLFTSGAAAGEPATAPEPSKEPEPAATAPEGRPGGAEPAETESASPDVSADLSAAPAARTAAPGPRHAADMAGDEPAEPAETGSAAGDEDALAPEPDAEPEPEPEPEPSGAAADDEPADEPDAEPADDGPEVRILSGTKRYHRVDCALIEDIGDEAEDLESLSRAEAKARGCTPCLVCRPDREPDRD